ncbi:MAG: DUF438 domain-containing protein [Bacillota bacterium]
MADTLLRINSGGISKDEAGKTLASISEVELSLAEQRLLERGVSPAQLQGLCKVHLQVLDKQAEDLLAATEPGHPLHTLVSEHRMILGFLDSLEEAAGVIERTPAWVSEDEALKDALYAVRDVAYHLVETEKHHAREEKALFPAMEERGITGPTRTMRLEHADLWPHKETLNDLAQNANPETYAEVRDEIVAHAVYIVGNLREHIMKENSILYPAAYQAIVYNAAWEDIKRKCDEIGYCCFTPVF